MDNRIVHSGSPTETADAAIVMIHGRNAAPENILDLLPVLDRPGFAAVAPGAAGGAWYPYSFMAERERNEPGITNGLAQIGSIVKELEGQGIPSHKIMLLGFSQGACLTAEFAIRNPKRYGGVMVLSGGVIGPPGSTWDDLPGSLDGTPVFLGCSDVDSHIPAARVLESETVFKQLGARVTRKLYAGMGHLVNKDEIENVQRVMDEVLADLK
ncbi:MAG: dienelactone hydrolase family protein [Gemmatimonadaceae bacterium]|nr:dienelactone hydrolase family protein [Gemmatimonadaceae bacterium]